MPEIQIVFHPSSPDVQIAIFKAEVFINLDIFIDIKGWSLGLIKYLDAIGNNLDITGSQLRIFSPRGTQGNLATYPDNIFIAYLVGNLVVFL